MSEILARFKYLFEGVINFCFGTNTTQNFLDSLFYMTKFDILLIHKTIQKKMGSSPMFRL